MPVEKFIIILAGISITAVIYSISLFAAIIVIIAYFIFMVFIRFDFSNIKYLRKIYFHSKSKGIVQLIKKELIYGIIGKTLFTAVEIENSELYTDSNKCNKIRILNNMVNGLACNTNIITKHEIYNGNIYYKTYLIIKEYGKNPEDSIDKINNDISLILSMPDLHATPVKDENIINSLLSGNIKTHSRYFQEDKMFCSYLDLIDMDYSQDFFYQTAIERSGIIVEINIDIKEIKNSEILIKRIISSRKAELVYNRSGHFASLIKKQISSLEYLQKQEKIYNVNIRFKIISEHPATLRSGTELFKKEMNTIGFKLHNFHFYNLDSFNILKLGKQGKKYIMDSQSISELFPCSFTPVPANNNKPLAINSITRKPFYLNLFNMNSYNVAITGETGSGKSYFTKQFLRLMKDKKIYVIDPLQEYNSGTVIDLSRGEYADFSINTMEISRIIAESLGEISGIQPNEIFNIILKLKIQLETVKFSSIISEINKIYSQENQISINTYDIPFNKAISPDNNFTTFRFDHRNASTKDAYFRLILGQIISIIEEEKGEKIVVVDESHLFLKNLQDAELMDMLARNSRHFRTSLLTITQNIDDYHLNGYSESILMNSINYFVFRQHGKIKDKLFLGYEIDPSGLSGGSSANYSECFYATGTLIRKLKIQEMENNTGKY